jgi:hypothetical protein
MPADPAADLAAVLVAMLTKVFTHITKALVCLMGAKIALSHQILTFEIRSEVYALGVVLSA